MRSGTLAIYATNREILNFPCQLAEMEKWQLLVFAQYGVSAIATIMISGWIKWSGKGIPIMQCPRCKTHDVYRSQSASSHLLSFMMMTVRCHRCCLQFSVPRWSNVPKKVATKAGAAQMEFTTKPRRAA